KWDVANGKLIADPKRIGSSFRIPILTMDGMSVLVENASRLCLLDAVTGKQKCKLQSDLVMDRVVSGSAPARIHCAFSPNGRLVALSDMVVADSDKRADQVPMDLRSYCVI